MNILRTNMALLSFRRNTETSEIKRTSSVPPKWKASKNGVYFTWKTSSRFLQSSLSHCIAKASKLHMLT